MNADLLYLHCFNLQFQEALISKIMFSFAVKSAIAILAKHYARREDCAREVSTEFSNDKRARLSRIVAICWLNLKSSGFTVKALNIYAHLHQVLHPGALN